MHFSLEGINEADAICAQHIFSTAHLNYIIVWDFCNPIENLFSALSPHLSL